MILSQEIVEEKSSDPSEESETGIAQNVPIRGKNTKSPKFSERHRVFNYGDADLMNDLVSMNMNSMIMPNTGHP